MKEFVSPTTYQRGQVIAFVLTQRHELPVERQDWYDMLVALVEMHARRIAGPALTSGYPKDPTALKSVTFDYVAKSDGADQLFFELLAEWMPEMKLLFIEPDATFFGSQRAWLLTGKIDRVTGFAHNRDLPTDRSKDPEPAYKVEWRGTVLYNTEEVRALANEAIMRLNHDGSRPSDAEWKGHPSWLDVFASQEVHCIGRRLDAEFTEELEAAVADTKTTTVDFLEYVMDSAYVARSPLVSVRKIQGALPDAIYAPLKRMLETEFLRLTGLTSGLHRDELDRYSDGAAMREQGVSFQFNAKYAAHSQRYIENLIRQSGTEGCCVDVLFFEHDPSVQVIYRTWSGQLTLENVSGWVHDVDPTEPPMGSDKNDPLQFHLNLTGTLRYGHPADHEEALTALIHLNSGTVAPQRTEQEA